MSLLDLNDAPAQEDDAGAKKKGRVSESALRSLNDRAAEIARALLGVENPKLSSATELRWGTHGSVSIEIAGPKAGAYYNHERKLGGGLMKMLAMEGGMAPGAAIDWLQSTLGIELEREKPAEPQRIVAHYDYHDEQGNVVYRINRWGPKKTFTQSASDGQGGWLSHKGVMDGVRLVPYRLPELLASINAPVFVVEGEKDVDRLTSIGLTATCNPGGAGKWPPEFAPHFTGRDVVILPDNDKAGKEHADLVARSLANSATRVRVIPLPGVGPKGDVSDWLDAGGTREQLEALIADTEKQEPTPIGDLIDTDAPYLIAGLFTARNYTSDGVLTLRHHRETFYAWSGAAYREISDDTLRAQLYAYLNVCVELDGKARQHPVKPDKSLVSNVFDALRAATHLSDDITAPCWLGSAATPADELIACENGLLHLPTLRLLPRSPKFFTLNSIDFPYLPDAPKPTEFQQFMHELWGDDPSSIDTLQEIFGLLLTGDTRYQKAFLLIGPKRSGKGTIARVLANMVGRNNVVAPVLSSLSDTHGLQPLIGKRLAIVSDARVSARADQAAIAERVLAITGEDILTVARKYKGSWTGQLQARFVILSNELPSLADASGALANRFIILVLTRSFFGQEDHALTARLLTELPGILNWSIAGWKRLDARGYFVQPESAKETSDDFADLGSPISSFVRDRCDVGAEYMVSLDDLYRVWCWWCEEQGRDKPGTKAIFGRNLKAAIPEIRVVKTRTDNGGRERYYAGIKIKPMARASSNVIDFNDAPLQEEYVKKAPWWVN
jgi:putative DNA primase/helicase